MSWENRGLPVFMGTSAEKLRRVLHRFQIDTTHFRPQTLTGRAFQSPGRSVNRTAVTGFHNSPQSELLDGFACNFVRSGTLDQLIGPLRDRGLPCSKR
jgi:hypothetical protein